MHSGTQRIPWARSSLCSTLRWNHVGHFSSGTGNPCLYISTVEKPRELNDEVRSSHKRVGDQHDRIERSLRGLFHHSLDEWLLSDLGQFNALEAIPQGLQGGPHSVQNLWGCFSRQGPTNCAPGLLRVSIRSQTNRPGWDGRRGFLLPPCRQMRVRLGYEILHRRAA